MYINASHQFHRNGAMTTAVLRQKQLRRTTVQCVGLCLCF